MYLSSGPPGRVPFAGLSRKVAICSSFLILGLAESQGCGDSTAIKFYLDDVGDVVGCEHALLGPVGLHTVAVEEKVRNGSALPPTRYDGTPNPCIRRASDVAKQGDDSRNHIFLDFALEL